MIPELSQRWRSNFGDTLPLSEWMRWQHHDRWFRIHSLPESKRYAENAGEMATILRRANTIASHVLGNGQEVWFISSIRSEYREEYEMDNDWPIKLHALAYWCEWKEPDSDPEFQYDWTSFARKISWNAGEFDPLLKRIADDEVHCILWFSPTLNTVFSPYDGGVDIWVRNEEQRESLYHSYKHWMSDRDDWM